jgi:hypothetical protein
MLQMLEIKRVDGVDTLQVEADGIDLPSPNYPLSNRINVIGNTNLIAPVFRG